MKHLVSREEAALVRFLVSGGDPLDQPESSDRIFQAPGRDGDEPLRILGASGRSSCRECGQPIEEGSPAIAFGFTPTGAVWAVGRAYIHAAEEDCARAREARRDPRRRPADRLES